MFTKNQISIYSKKRHLSGMAIIFSFLIVSMLHLSYAQSAAKALEFKIEKFVLANGLTVIVHEDSSIPLLSYQQWFRVGSAHEQVGRTGFAHFFEHLVFKGTNKYPGDVYESLLQKNGGDNNAFTTRDYTGYYTNLPSDKLELIIDIESDRMRNLLFDQKEIDSEREVVKEERRMRYENSIFGSLYLGLVNTMYKTGPYSWPTIGSMKDLNAAKLTEFKSFYDQYYVPNNAVVVIAGDVKKSQVKSLIEKYYGQIPARDLPEFKPVAEAEQRAPRQLKIYKDVQAETIAIGYPTPNVFSDDTYALEFLSMALGGGASSRLYKNIVYKNQLATSVSASLDSKKLAGDLSIFISMKPGQTSSRSIQLVMTEIQRMQNELLTEAELAKLRNMVKLWYLNGLKTVSSRANQLAEAETVFGDYNRVFTNIDKYNSVTAEDIRRVAQKYMLSEKRTLVVIAPKAANETTADKTEKESQ
jgi:zinc protease